MLTYRYLNGYDYDNFLTPIFGRFAPYVPTPTVDHNFEQGIAIPGAEGGQGWCIFNTAFWETNHHALLGAPYQSVVYKCYLQARNGGADAGLPVYNKVLFLRFENGANNWGIQVRIRIDGRLEILRGGNGLNDSTGPVLFITDESLPPSEWVSFEMRIDSGVGGRVRLWLDNDQKCDISGIDTGTTAIDRVTFRWQSFGQIGLGQDHLAIASDDTVSSDRIGEALVKSSLPNADFQISPLWIPNAGVNHFSRLNEAGGEFIPDENTYLTGSPGGDDLYTVAPFNCTGRILALAVNPYRKLISGAPTLAALLLHPAAGSVQTIPLGFTEAISATLRYQQHVMSLDPVTGDYWNDGNIAASAWGIRGGGTGSVRVEYLSFEKLVSLQDLSYECGGGQHSYII